MEYLKKGWVRFIVSWFIGGFIVEICILSFSKDPTTIQEQIQGY